jgi:hypothetical protein
VVDEAGAAVVKVEELAAVVATVVTVELEVVGTAGLSTLTALTITPATKTSVVNPMRRPTRLSMEGPRIIGAGV